MNTIEITTRQDLEVIFTVPLFLTYNVNCQEEEIYHNLWAISLNPTQDSFITEEELIDFFRRLLHGYHKQRRQGIIKNKCTFYLWYDDMASQLRFNIISGCSATLPFGCQLHYCSTPLPIVHAFLKMHSFSQVPEKMQTLTSITGEPFILDIYKYCIE